MNEVIHSFNDDKVAMSSLEVAKLVGSRHHDVMKSIRRLVNRGVIEQPQCRSSFYINNLGHRVPAEAYIFQGTAGKRDSIVVVAQLSPEFTARLVDRWQELEQKAIQDAVPKTMPEALRLAADLAEKNEQLTMVARQQGDRIKSLQNLFESGVTPFEFAKRLNGVNCQQINAELNRRGWLYRDSFGSWRASSKARDLYLTERSGRMERSDGRVMVTATPVLLQRGAAYLHKLYLHEQLPMKKTWDGQFTHDKSTGGEA
mgnify:CR=1 FL=1